MTELFLHVRETETGPAVGVGISSFVELTWPRSMPAV